MDSNGFSDPYVSCKLKPIDEKKFLKIKTFEESKFKFIRLLIEDML